MTCQTDRPRQARNSVSITIKIIRRKGFVPQSQKLKRNENLNLIWNNYSCIIHGENRQTIKLKPNQKFTSFARRNDFYGVKIWELSGPGVNPNIWFVTFGRKIRREMKNHSITLRRVEIWSEKRIKREWIYIFASASFNHSCSLPTHESLMGESV